MNFRTPFSWLTLGEITLLGAIWGASFLFMRVSAADFGPVALVEIRLILGALVLMPFLWRAKAGLSASHIWKLVVIGLVSTAIPFMLFAWGAERAPAGIGAITNAMTVLFAVLVAFIFYGEKIGSVKAIGLLAGFVGVVVLASGKTAGTNVWPAAIAGTCAALCYGIAVNLIRRQLSGIPAGAAAAATLLSASVVLLPFAIPAWPRQPIPVQSWMSAVALGVICTGLASALYYRLINRVGAAQAATVTYLIPLFAVIWAWIILAEPLTATMAASACLILSGVALSQRRVAVSQ